VRDDRPNGLREAGVTALLRLIALLCGTDHGMRRMLQYWLATCVLYVICIGLLTVQVIHCFIALFIH
jgi:hypothetical protein